MQDWISLTWLRWFGFGLKTLSIASTSTSKNDACFKNDQSRFVKYVKHCVGVQ